MTWEDVVAIGKSLPEVEESTSYGFPSLKVRGKFLTRLRPEDDSVVLVGATFDEREMMIDADPLTFHTTPQYKDYPSVLARLAHVDAATVMTFLERRWRAVAPKALVRAYNDGSAAPRKPVATK